MLGEKCGSSKPLGETSILFLGKQNVARKGGCKIAHIYDWQLNLKDACFKVHKGQWPMFIYYGEGT